MAYHELFSLRIAEPDDAPLLAPLIQELAAEEGVAPPAEAALIELIQVLIETRFSDFLVAEQHGAVVGCLQINYRLSTWRVAPYAYLEDVYLVPDARGQGIGHKLLDYACQIASARGCQEVQLDVRPDNQVARKLYARYGFKRKQAELWARPLPTDSFCSDPAEVAEALRPFQSSGQSQQQAEPSGAERA